MGAAEILAAIAAGKGIVTAAVSIGRALFAEGKLTKAELDEIEARADQAFDARMASARAMIEQSAELALLCPQGGLSADKMGLWNTGLQSGIEQFSDYCQQVRQLV